MAPSVQASITRRWGWWLYAEYRLINMRAYLQTILIRAIGLPLLYLSSMGLGWATWSARARAASTG
ncbi:MAG: hypothetical protein R2742_14770 [Micropruina glycogenica]